MVKSRIFIAGIFIGAAFLAGCSGNECYENHSALPLASFYNYANLQPVSLNQVCIYGIGAPGDSILYTTQNLSQAYLPFRVWQDTTQYVFQYVGMVSEDLDENISVQIPSDTISFCYRPKPWFVSPACGAMYFYEMDTVAHSSFLIDSISYNKVITNENSTNIKIFFRDAPAE